MTHERELTSIEKRVRRHIRAKEHAYFAVCQPGFEQDCLNEIAEITALPCFATEGGVAFRGKLDALYRASAWSFCATRFLMRVAHFRADNFDYFKRQFAAIAWDLYLPQKCSLSFSISCRKSRLMHTGRLEQDSGEVLASFADAEGPAQKIYIRFFHDICTVSLDASGEALYRRSYRTITAEAPLRETSASLILRHAGLQNYEALIDPMAGSGVFSIEAFMQSEARIPQHKHHFPFFHWPVFSEPMFRNTLEKQILKPFPLLIHSSDISGSCVDIIKKNFLACGLNSEAKCENFFSLSNPFPGKKSLIILNPPYGERIALHDAEDFYKKIIGHLQQNFMACDFALIIPQKLLSQIDGKIDYREKLRFHNGNILTYVLFGSV